MTNKALLGINSTIFVVSMYLYYTGLSTGAVAVLTPLFAAIGAVIGFSLIMGDRK